MTAKRVFITRSILSAGKDLLERKGVLVDQNTSDHPLSYNELKKLAKNYDALVTMLTDQIDEAFLAENSHLEIIANYAVGFNNIDLAAAKKFQIAITNTPDVLTEATAEVALGLMIAAARNFHEASQTVRDGQWTSWHPQKHLGPSLREKTLGIVGAGRIGSRLAEMASHAFSMKILYSSRSPKNLGPRAQLVPLEELMAQSDFVSLHVPLTPSTRGLIGKRELALMKQEAVIINTARGEIIDQDALIESLKKREIFAAGLDVTTPEPLPLESELLKLPNVFILPHIGSASFEARTEMALLCAKNILAKFEGRKLLSPVSE